MSNFTRVKIIKDIDCYGLTLITLINADYFLINSFTIWLI